MEQSKVCVKYSERKLRLWGSLLIVFIQFWVGWKGKGGGVGWALIRG